MNDGRALSCRSAPTSLRGAVQKCFAKTHAGRAIRILGQGYNIEYVTERYSRRDFLGILRKTLPPFCVLSSIGGALNYLAEQNWTRGVELNEIDEVERRFAIKIFSPDGSIGVIDELVRQELGVNTQEGLIKLGIQKLIPWENSQLTIVSDTLGQVPPKLYTSRNGSISFMIAEFKSLTSEGDGGFKGGACIYASSMPYDDSWGGVFENSGRDAIVLSERDISPHWIESREHAECVTVHELVHLHQNEFTRSGKNAMVDRVLEIIGILSGKEIYHPCDELADIFSQRCTAKRDDNGNILWVRCEEKNRLGVIGQLPSEAIPVAAELYFGGDAVFAQSFIPLIGRERTDHLYNFMKEEIFDGRIYEGGIWINN